VGSIDSTVLAVLIKLLLKGLGPGGFEPPSVGFFEPFILVLGWCRHPPFYRRLLTNYFVVIAAWCGSALQIMLSFLGSLEPTRMPGYPIAPWVFVGVYLGCFGL